MLMKAVVDSGFSNLSQMNFEISGEQKLVLDEVDRACRELRPLEDEAYISGSFNQHLIPVFKKAQLLGLPISRMYGEGQGADILPKARFIFPPRTRVYLVGSLGCGLAARTRRKTSRATLSPVGYVAD